MTQKEYTRHHIWFNKASYRTPLQRALRSSAVQVINHSVHRELHANVPPPPMPSRYEMAGAIMASKGIQGIVALELQCYSFIDAKARYEALDMERDVIRAGKIVANLTDQLSIIGGSLRK